MKRFAPFFEPMESGFAIGLEGKALESTAWVEERPLLDTEERRKA